MKKQITVCAASSVATVTFVAIKESIMITHDPLITPSELAARVKSQPMPSREELMKRNSFGSVNNNKYLNRWLGAKK